MAHRLLLLVVVVVLHSLVVALLLVAPVSRLVQRLALVLEVVVVEVVLHGQCVLPCLAYFAVHGR